MGTIILWVAKRLGVTALLSSIIVYGAMALTATGTVWYYKHRYDDAKREEGRVECRAEAAKTAERNRLNAEAINATREAERLKTEATLRRKIAAIRSAQADACSEAPALPSILDGLR